MEIQKQALLNSTEQDTSMLLYESEFCGLTKEENMETAEMRNYR
jgi:hypothetical protein